MAAGARRRPRPTDGWEQLRLLVASPEQATYEQLRPIVLFGQSAAVRARATGVPERTLRRKAARFDAVGMRSLFEVDAPPEPDRRTLPLGIRQAIVDLKADDPPLGPFAIARICRHRFDRPVSYHTVQKVLASAPLPLRPHRRIPRYREMADPVARRRAVVTLYLDGWSPKTIAGYLETSRQTVYDVLRRWDAEGWPGLDDRPLGPRQPARKVDLKAMVAIRRLQANPELGAFRIHGALEQLGVHLSPSTCGRILALHRELGAPKPVSIPREPDAMPFAAVRRHQYWSVDVRSIDDHRLGTGKPVYVHAPPEYAGSPAKLVKRGLGPPAVGADQSPFPLPPDIFTRIAGEPDPLTQSSTIDGRPMWNFLRYYTKLDKSRFVLGMSVLAMRPGVPHLPHRIGHRCCCSVSTTRALPQS